jgi:hypothetical protein
MLDFSGHDQSWSINRNWGRMINYARTPNLAAEVQSQIVSNAIKAWDALEAIDEQ